VLENPIAQNLRLTDIRARLVRIWVVACEDIHARLAELRPLEKGVEI
jgi:hypothetical protein